MLCFLLVEKLTVVKLSRKWLVWLRHKVDGLPYALWMAFGFYSRVG